MKLVISTRNSMVVDRMKAMGSNGYVGSAAAAIIAGVSLVAQRMPYMPKPSEYRFPCFPAPYLVYGLIVGVDEANRA